MKYQRNGTVESAPMKDETILYDPSSVKFCALNETAAYLWERLETPRSVVELLGDLSVAFRLDDHGKAEQDLHGLLDELVGLSFVAPDVTGNGNGSTAASDCSDLATDTAAPKAYGAPRIRVMDESEVLASFQITSAGISWWVM